MVIAHGHEPQLQIVDADLHENHVGQGRKQGLRLAPRHVIAEHNKEFVAPDALHGAGVVVEGQHGSVLGYQVATAHVKLGEVLRAEGAADEAIDHFERAVALSPALLAAHYQLGVTLDEEGDGDNAIRQYRLALQIAPDNGEIHHRLGTALAASGQTRLGLIHLETAMRLEPDLQTAQGAGSTAP